MEQRYGIGIVYPGIEPLEIVNATVKHDVQLVATETFDAAKDYHAWLAEACVQDAHVSFLFIYPGRESLLVACDEEVELATRKWAEMG